MLQKEKIQLDGQTCYLLGESNYSYGLVYLLESDDEYELIYRDEHDYINEINTFDGYRLYEPNEIYDMLGEFVLTDEEIAKFNYKMYEYHVALGARNIAEKFSRFRDDKLCKSYDDIMSKIRIEISELLNPDGNKNN